MPPTSKLALVFAVRTSTVAQLWCNIHSFDWLWSTEVTRQARDGTQQVVMKSRSLDKFFALTKLFRYQQRWLRKSHAFFEQRRCIRKLPTGRSVA